MIDVVDCMLNRLFGLIQSRVQRGGEPSLSSKNTSNSHFVVTNNELVRVK